MSSWSPPPPSPGFDSSSSSSPFENLKPSILVIILILCITLLVSVSLCLLLRHLNRFCLLRLSSVSSSPSVSASNRHSATNRVSPENPDHSLLDSLPLFTFASIKRRSSSTFSADCAVCLSKFEAQDQLRLLPLCCHAFHAECIDTWLLSNQTCPLCRSSVLASDSDLVKAISGNADEVGTDSFRLEIGSISRRRSAPDSAVAVSRGSYSVGSFEYIVDDDSEVNLSQTHRRSVSDKDNGAAPTPEEIARDENLAAEVAGARSWLKDYVDRLSFSVSSRAQSFRSSGRFFAGSSRRSEIGGVAEFDVESGRVGEEISELFRWFSGV